MVSIEQCVEALSKISRAKTAPYYEVRVARYIASELDRMGVAWEVDEVGDILATYEGTDAAGKSPVALVAHMDHPAFEIIDVEGKMGRLLGNVRAECFNSPVRVLVYPAVPHSDSKRGVPGVIVRARVSEGETIFDLHLEGDCPPLPAFGVWDFPDIKMDGDIAYLRAADDLVGCAAILLALEGAKKRQLAAKIIGVFTRAEEINFLGAIHVAASGRLPKDSIIISLEASKTIPGAEMGAGPVIRVGDRRHTFDDAAEGLLRMASEELRKENDKLLVQRQLMSGGSCEGSLFTVEGYRSTAIALPLGNYHNMTSEMTLGPEYISVSDMATEVELLLKAAELNMEDCRKSEREQLVAGTEKQLEKLRELSYDVWQDD